MEYCFIIRHMSGQGKHSCTILFIAHFSIHFTLQSHWNYILQECMHFQEVWLSSNVKCNIGKLFGGTCFLMKSGTCRYKGWFFFLWDIFSSSNRKSTRVFIFKRSPMRFANVFMLEFWIRGNKLIKDQRLCCHLLFSRDSMLVEFCDKDTWA